MLFAATYVALIIASWGMTSLVTDRDVIAQRDAGPLLGPAMAAAASLVVAIALWRMPARPKPVVQAVAATASVYIAMLVVGAAGYTLTRGDFTWMALFTGTYALSPFITIPAILGGLVILAAVLVDVRFGRAATIDRGDPEG